MVCERNQIIADWLLEHQQEIEQGKIKVFVEDESHLKAGDICGYGWGDKKQRRDVEVENYRESQTYYGAVDCLSGQMFVDSQTTANTSSTIKFVKYLQAQNPGAKIVLIWDGASYHRSQEFRDFLSQVNQGEDWKVHCLRFPPYAPKENPIENIWGQLKQILRKFHQRCGSFRFTKKLFEMLIKYHLFRLPDLSEHKAFSNII